MKWYTCTPVPFKGDHTFFCRDSGAFCKAFQRIGVESRAIMPTPIQGTTPTSSARNTPTWKIPAGGNPWVLTDWFCMLGEWESTLP